MLLRIYFLQINIKYDFYVIDQIVINVSLLFNFFYVLIYLYISTSLMVFQTDLNIHKSFVIFFVKKAGNGFIKHCQPFPVTLLLNLEIASV
jgi:hypothetical protein